MRNIAGALFLCLAAAHAAEPGKIRIQLVTGGHSHDISFYEIFSGNREYQLTVNPHPSAFRFDLVDRFDVLVLYDLAEVEAEKDRAILRRFVESGKGVVALHHALGSNQQWPWWYEEVIGGKYFMRPEGKHPASTYKHDVPLTINVVKKHPVTAGVDRFPIVDEIYGRLWLSPKIDVLLETSHPESDGVVGWISPYAKSRVVYLQLGHGREALENPNYRKLVHNAIAWAAGRQR